MKYSKRSMNGFQGIMFVVRTGKGAAAEAEAETPFAYAIMKIF